MKYTKEQLKKIWDTQVDYSKRIDKATQGLKEIFDGFPVINLSAPIDIIATIDPELYNVLEYIFYEVSVMKQGGCVEYPDGTKLNLDYTFESLLKLCEKEGLIK